jgi:hypothetical protein
MSKRFLGGTVAIVIGIVTLVHWQQKYEQTEMKKGIQRDKERLALKKNMTKGGSKSMVVGK